MRKNRSFAGVLVWAVTGASAVSGGQPLGTGFTYQGQLKQDGAPVSGATDFVFRLFDAGAGGTQIGTDVVRNGVSVFNGLFTVDLDFGAAAFNGDARFLEVAVEGAPLASRQPIGPTPYALKVPGIDGHSLDAADGNPSDAVFVNAVGNVGIGTTGPSRELEVAGAADVEIGIRSTDANGRLWTLQSSRVNGTATDGTFQIIDRTAGASRLTITPTANVGIGTTSPANRLHVFNGAAGVAPFGNAELALEDNGSCYVSLVAPDAGESGILFGNPGGGAAAGGVLFNAGVADGLSFRTGANDTRMVLTSSGRLGLGTAAPTAAIDVRGGTLTTPVLSVAGSTQASVEITAGSGHPTGASLTSGIPGDISLTAGNGGLSEACLPTCATSPSGGGSVTIRGGDAASVPLTQGAPGGDILLLPGAGGDGAPSDGAPGSVGISTETPSSSFRLDVNGAVRCTTLTETSSRSLKRNVRPLPDPLPRLLRLQGVAFEWDETHGAGTDIGLIAEDAAEVFPELVTWEPDGTTAAGLKYSHLTAVLVEALKQQQAQIEQLIGQNDAQLKARDDVISQLNERLARLEARVERKSGVTVGDKP